MKVYPYKNLFRSDHCKEQADVNWNVKNGPNED